MRPLILALSVALAGCGFDSFEGPKNVGVVEQALGTAWLFELDGASAGSVSSVTSAGALCGASALEFTLGPNMSAASRLWLDAAISGKQGVHDAAIYLASTGQRLSFSSSSVQRVEFPRAASGDATQVFFTVKLVTSKPASCTSVSPAVIAQKNALAAGWASRTALAKDVTTRLGKGSPASPTRTLSYADFDVSSLKIEIGATGYQAAEDYARSVIESGAIEEFKDILVVPRDAYGVPLLGIRWYGPAKLEAGLDGAGNYVINGSVVRAHLTSALADGGVQ